MQYELKKAFDDTVSERILNTVPNMPDHVFSKQFEKRMARLIRRGSPTPRRKITVKRLMTCIAAALIAAVITALSVSAIRILFQRFSTEAFNTHTDVRSTDTADSPNSIEDVYEIAIPDEFKLIYCEDEIFEWSPFILYEYHSGDRYIIFSQWVKSKFDVSVNTEGRPMEYILINGHEGFIIDFGNDDYFISWDNGDYIFTVQGNVNKNNLILIAESVQNAEK
ncbi:MAG: DUF4367 domain-containing protein [Oscillospiraceae bacterium]|nr:DUF4367 domain-containing protein [Oscillospiraceae bacterium]